jgi:hypothetical protein
MLKREAALKPRVEHPVWKDVIGGSCAAESAPCTKAVVLPETVDDDRIVAGMVLAQPGHEGGGKRIGVARGTEGVQAQGKVADFGVRGIIEGYHFHGVAVALVYGRKAPHGFRRATTGGADGSDDVKEFHGRREMLEGRGESLHGLYLSGHGADLTSVAGRVMNLKYPNGIMKDEARCAFDCV